MKYANKFAFSKHFVIVQRLQVFCSHYKIQDSLTECMPKKWANEALVYVTAFMDDT